MKKAKFKIWMATSNKPKVVGRNLGEWRRLKWKQQ